MTAVRWLCCDLAQAVRDGSASGTLCNLVGATSADPEDRAEALALLRRLDRSPVVDLLVLGLAG